jgi:tripartite-type tricarboxylate transporter receptor subunit TctC
MNNAINRAMETAEAKEKFALQGMESTKNTSPQFGSFLQSEVKKWATVVVSSGAKVE